MSEDSILSKKQFIYSIDQLKAIGLSNYKINQLVKNGLLEKLNKKYYKNTNYASEYLDFYYASAYAPHGVICLMSAASYYELTRYIPDSIDVAIDRKSKISSLPNWPSINIHYFTDIRFSTGIKTVSNEYNKFKIYDIEKSVIDIIYYRNSIGIEETKEILINYLKREDRNINRLIRYGDMLKCGDILKAYLEVLV